MPHQVLFANVQELIDNQRIPAVQANPGQQIVLTTHGDDNDDDSFFRSFHEYAEIQSHFDDLCKKNPHLVTSFTIGKTFEGRPINGVHIKSPNQTSANLREIVFHGGIHAREWIGPVRIYF